MEAWQIAGMLLSCGIFGVVYAFLVVRRVNETTSRITHYEVVIGVSVVLLTALAWGIIDLPTFALLMAAFAAAGFWMWLEYEGRVTKAIERKDHDTATF